jgi:uncharacterized protein
MFYHVILTTECNLECTYCYGEALKDFDEDISGINVDYSLPKNANYDFSLLAKLCKRDPNCVLTFYGGEPLLCITEIKQIMDLSKPQHFMIQTNGLLLDRLEAEYVNRFHTILISLDGDEKLTNYYRGEDTFRKVIENVKLILRNGFKGELIARMTVMEQTDIYKQVKWFVENEELRFSSIHWQLNAGFWKNDYARRNFKLWSENSYLPGIVKLAEFWVNQMETRGIVLKLYPLLGVTHTLLHNEKNSFLRCGGGWINYAIQTDGHIIPCPTMWGMKNYYIDHLKNVHPSKLEKIYVGPPCTDCNILSVCGGRCLYANVTNRWRKEAYFEVCNTVRGLIKVINKKLPYIFELIKKKKVRLSDFDFMKYNGCEIIP